MTARGDALALLGLVAIIVPACARSAYEVRFAPAATKPWWGCYVIHWDPPAPDWLTEMDSVRLDSTTSLDSSQTSWHRIPFPTRSHYERGYLGPTWRLVHDTLKIEDGFLSGWEITALRSDSGFVGRASTFTDFIDVSHPTQAPSWAVVASRAACPPDLAGRLTSG